MAVTAQFCHVCDGKVNYSLSLSAELKHISTDYITSSIVGEFEEKLSIAGKSMLGPVVLSP